VNDLYETKPFEKDLTGKNVVICFSQGLDSTTLAFYYKSRGCKVTLAFFDDGLWNDPNDQFYDPTRPICLEHFMSEEPDFYARYHKRNSGMDFVKIRYPQLNALHAVVPPDNSAAEQAEGLGLHFWVGYKPIMSIVLMGYGAAHNKDAVVFGHLLEDTAYYDEQPQPFIELQKFMDETYKRVKIPRVMNPFQDWGYNKQDVIALALKVGVPLEYTYSCRRMPALREKGGRFIPCGVCENCLRRIEAFRIFGMKDPCEYTA
jgi:7-cyano-7-deazaguanine synthase in queuosine biosynthesis